MSDDVAHRLANLYPLRSLRSYVRWKVRSDPAYDAVLQRLRNRERPVIDLGCGIGLLPFYLREHGFRALIVGIDFDARKIELARAAAMQYRGIDFVRADARDPLPGGHDVVLLDILQYFDHDSQQQILRNVASSLQPGSIVIIRQGVRDSSWRFKWQSFIDGLARTFRWMRAERLNFPTRNQIVLPFDGFEQEVTPLWGRSPFNNYLFVFRRAVSSGMTNE